MLTNYNSWLIVAAVLSAVAALLHVAIVVGGAPWYRFFGAGERMASAAETGRAYPAIVTLSIAIVLALWATYALSLSLVSIFCVALPFSRSSSLPASRPLQRYLQQ